MFRSFIKYILLIMLLTSYASAYADYKLNWRLKSKQQAIHISIIYRDAEHIMIKTNQSIELLKLKDKLYLLYKIGKIGYLVKDTRANKHLQQAAIFKQLPQIEYNFMPVMLINGDTKTISGIKGSTLQLKDYNKSITVICSFDATHIKVKNAIIPLIDQLLNAMPNLPNKALLDILRHKSFGLPIKIDKHFALTQSMRIKPSNKIFSLKGYHIINEH